MFKSLFLKPDFVWHELYGKVKIKYIKLDQATDPKIKKLYFFECARVLSEAWGKFPTSFILNRIYNSDLVIIALHNESVIGFSQYKFYTDTKYQKEYCGIGLSVINTPWQGNGINFRILSRLFLFAFLRNIQVVKSFKLDFLFESNSIDSIEAIIPISVKLYPDPRKANIKTGKVNVSNDETWHRVKHYVAATGERIFRLQREGSVIVRSYDDMPHLIRKSESKITNEKSRKFSDRYFKHEKKSGNEIVVHAVCSLFKFIKYVYI